MQNFSKYCPAEIELSSELIPAPLDFLVEFCGTIPVSADSRHSRLLLE